MSYFAVILCVLMLVAVFIGPLLWDLLRENSRLNEEADQFQHFKMACENAPDGMLVQDMNAKILWANPAFARIQNLPLEDIIGKSPLAFALPDNQKPSEKDIREFRYDPDDPKWKSFELIKNQRADGSTFWNQISVSFVHSAGNCERAILVCRDVTEQVEQENRLRDIGFALEHEASHDGLTGVPNRAAFMSFFETALLKSDHPHIGLLHIDLDEFKAVNDTHGHSAGDAVLRHAAKTVREHIRGSDMVARVGGDEFVVVCLGMTSLSQLNTLGNDLIGLLSEPFEWNNRTLQNEASVGAVLSTGHETETETLLVQADFALYEAKREGRNRVAVYDDNMHEHHNYLNQRSAELIDAVDTDALQYFFQPTMDLSTGAIIGFETLVRWEHATDGIIPPDHFLPLAQDLGLMGALDLLSMTAALKEKRRLALAGFPDIKIAFNASPELLTHPEFINRLIWGGEAGGIDREHITIEVLETTDFGEAHESTSHAAIIGDLRSAGFNVHLDDFGVGFAGLSHLATLDVTGVKVDRSLVKDILTDQTSLKIVRKIVELSNDLGLCVIAEGVEDDQTAAALSDMGCNVIQGYWLSRPLPKDALLDWLAKHEQLRVARSA